MTDDHVVALVRSSVVYRAADAALRAVEAGWRASSARAVFSRAHADRMRFWSIAVLMASVTALGVAPLGAAPRPLAWLVPAGAAAVSLLILIRPRR